MYRFYEVFDVRLRNSRESEPVQSLDDVASSDTESSDTATNTTDVAQHGDY